MVLSIGCGGTRNQQNDRESPLFCCTHSFFEGMSASRQNSELILRGYRFTRLDPFLDIDGVSLDDFQSIPKLQQSFSTMLSHDTAFVELLRSAAFELISSMFYFEIVSQPVFRPKSTEYSVTGTIRPRLPSSSLRHLYRHEYFHPLHFVVETKRLRFSMPKRVNIRVKNLDSPVNVALSCKAYQARISGSPMSVTELLRVQECFYRRKGSLKRRMLRSPSGE